MKALIRKFGSFVLISGAGWLIDFGVFTLLTALLHFSVLQANYCSTVPAVTFVFLVSTRKTFRCREGGLSMPAKYAIYVVYQLALVTAVSFFGQWLYEVLLPLCAESVLRDSLKLLVKVAITPVTMLMNFLVLGRIAEKM